jgi:hypothetical protein
MQPTDCYTVAPPEVMDSICVEGEDIMDTIPLLPDSIVINGQYDVTVDFTIVQEWDDLVGIAIKHSNLEFESSCDIYGNVTLGDSFDFQSQCVSGYTTVTIVVYLGSEFNPEECDACNVEDLSDMGGKFCAYSVEIPCELDIVKQECFWDIETHPTVISK